jgi:hypothetical protein
VRGELFDHRASTRFRSAILPYSSEAIRLSSVNDPAGCVKNIYKLAMLRDGTSLALSHRADDALSQTAVAENDFESGCHHV